MPKMTYQMEIDLTEAPIMGEDLVNFLRYHDGAVIIITVAGKSTEVQKVKWNSEDDSVELS